MISEIFIYNKNDGSSVLLYPHIEKASVELYLKAKGRDMWEHQNGLAANHTKKRLPVKLVYCEPCDRVEDAFRREKQVQGWSRRKKQALIEANREKLIEYSRNYTQYGKLASVASTVRQAHGSATDGRSKEKGI